MPAEPPTRAGGLQTGSTTVGALLFRHAARHGVQIAGGGKPPFIPYPGPIVLPGANCIRLRIAPE